MKSPQKGQFETRISLAPPTAVTGTGRTSAITSGVSTPWTAVVNTRTENTSTIATKTLETMASTVPPMIQSKIDFLQDPEYDGDIHDPSLGPLSKLSPYNYSRKEQDEEDCPLLAQTASQVVTTVPANTCDDPAIWTTVVNTRKEKRRRKLTEGPQNIIVRNTKPTASPEQHPFTNPDEDWVENHFQPREWLSRKSRKSIYHPRNKLGLAPNKRKYPPQNKSSCGPKYFSKPWDIDTFDLGSLNTDYPQQFSPAVPYKKKLNSSTISPPETQPPHASDDTQPKTLPPAIAKHSTKVLTSAQARLRLKAAQARNQDLRNYAETLGIKVDQCEEEKHQESQRPTQTIRTSSNQQTQSTLHSDNELMIVQRELRDQKASITNQSNMINELAKSVDSSNTRFKNLSETIQAFLTTFHRQESGQEHTAPRPRGPEIPPARTIRSNDTSTNTKEPRYTSQHPSMTQITKPKTYAESQRRAMYPLLPTPNFDWYDNIREEACPFCPTHTTIKRVFIFEISSKVSKLK